MVYSNYDTPNCSIYRRTRLRSRSNCSFCRNPKYQEKHLWPKYRLLGHSAVAAGISHINGIGPDPGPVPHPYTSDFNCFPDFSL